MRFKYYEMEVWAIEADDLPIEKRDLSNYKIAHPQIFSKYPYFQGQGHFDELHKLFIFYYEREYRINEDLYRHYLQNDIDWCPRIYKEKIKSKAPMGKFLATMHQISKVPISRYFLIGLEMS